jgi:hypothetical protein
VTLLRVAWLAILLGLLLQLALLLVAARFGTATSSRTLLAETLRTVSWSLLVCVGVALGRVAAKGRLPLEGVTGLLAAALALTAANAIQKGVAEATNATGVPAGPPPVWVLAIKTRSTGRKRLLLGRCFADRTRAAYVLWRQSESLHLAAGGKDRGWRFRWSEVGWWP